MEKEKFLNYCKMFTNELADLQMVIDNDGNTEIYGTLAYIGANYSYELANIGIELGYSTWLFQIGDYDNFGNYNKYDFEEIKKGLYNTIVENETIVKCYDNNELEDVITRIIGVQYGNN